MEVCVYQKLDTRLHADSVEWCRHDKMGSVLACGRYQLNEETRERIGGVLLYTLERNHGNDPSLKASSCESDTAVACGVLDMKWSTEGDGPQPVLALACSDGSVRNLQLRHKEDGQPFLELVGKFTLKMPSDPAVSSLCLSVDWAQDASGKIAASDSQGCLTVLAAQQMKPVRLWKAHSDEAWIAAFCQNSNLVLSGGDDSQLCLWDTRLPNGSARIACIKHEAGVCSIQSHPFNDHIIASGGYDEMVSLWDQRNLVSPLHQISLGGGVWRVKWHPSRPDLMATACIYNGFKIIGGLLSSPSIMGTYSEHGSLAYGIDWMADSPQSHGSWALSCDQQTNQTDSTEHQKEWVLASCSFYDHALHLWSGKEK